MSLWIFEYFRLVFGDYTTDVNIEHLATIVTDQLIVIRRYRRPIYGQSCGDLRIVDLLKRGADAAWLTAGFFVSVIFSRFFVLVFGKTILGRRFATVAAV